MATPENRDDGDAFGVIDAGAVLPSDEFSPISDVERDEYEADVDRVMHHDRDGDGDVDWKDVAQHKLSEIKDLIARRSHSDGDLASKIAAILDRVDGRGDHHRSE